MQCVNASYRRSGTLWEGQHKSSLIDTEGYLMSCYRYIELNPVRAGMVRRPGDCPRSSYEAYRELFRQQLDAQDIQDLRTAINLCVPIGSDRFKVQIERRLKQRISYRPWGRPRKDLASE